MTFSPEAWQTLAITFSCFGMLIFTRLPVDAILIGGVSVLVVLNVLTPAEALSGMSNEGMVTVGVLFIVAQGLSQTGVVSWISQNLLGRPKSTAAAQFRLMLPVAAFSTVLNNTPVVAMLVPAVSEWAKRNNLSVSQLMIPLSYAAIIGGTCTLVGTSTNLVINGMLMDLHNGPSLGMFDLAWIGVPCVLLVMAFTIIFSRWLLPRREGSEERFEDARQYIVEMEVEMNSPVVGQSIEEAGLRQLPGMFLIEIDRDGRLITVVSPREVLQSGDHLIFAGDVRSVVDLKNIRGLKVAEKQVFKLGAGTGSRCLVEVVISPNFPFLNKSVRDSGFRNHYGAAIIAMVRNGQQVKTKIGDVELQPGDTLLLEADSEFIERQRYSRDFLLVGQVENSQEVRHEHRHVSAAILVAMVVAVALGWLSMFKAALLAAGLMLLTRCLRVREARQCVDWQILLVIAASIALGVAMDKTGAANVLAGGLVGLTVGSPLATLAALFVITTAFSALISNLAAAVLMFPVAVAASHELDVALLPFAVTLMIAASTCFATPIGYQTNLMVYGPGKYRFIDFMIIGIPLTLLVGLATILIVPQIWPF